MVLFNYHSLGFINNTRLVSAPPNMTAMHRSAEVRLAAGPGAVESAMTPPSPAAASSVVQASY